jgi:hypothetical protein
MYGFFFHYSMLLKFPPAIHRFVTSFLITSKDLGVLFDTYFVYTYLSQLEKSNAKFSKKEDLIWYLTFVGGVIIVGQPRGSLFHFLFLFVFVRLSPFTAVPHISARIVSCPYYYHGSWN